MIKIKQISALLCLLFLVACGFNSSKPSDSDTSDSVVYDERTFFGTDVETMPNEYQRYYVVVADTSASYSLLQKQMFVLEDKLLFEIDTLGRYYDAKNDLICLPKNDPDEVYAGNYFPRRFASATLSLEYLNFYKPEAAEKSIALVAGIYEGEGEANVRLADVKKLFNSAFIIKSDVFVGCMH